MRIRHGVVASVFMLLIGVGAGTSAVPMPDADAAAQPGVRDLERQRPARPIGGTARLWWWDNIGTTSTDFAYHRGIGLDPKDHRPEQGRRPATKYAGMINGGWAWYIGSFLAPAGNPPAIIRNPFGSTPWVRTADERGKLEVTTAFRFEDVIDALDDDRFSFLFDDWVEAWGAYPNDVIFHIGTADDRELSDVELARVVKIFVDVAKRRELLRSKHRVYVCLDHSQWFDPFHPDAEKTPSANPIEGQQFRSRRTKMQSAIVAQMLSSQGVGVLTEAVPIAEQEDAASYWSHFGVAFRPGLETPKGHGTPMRLDRFEGLVLAWYLPKFLGDDTEENYRSVLRGASEYGNVSVPPYKVGGNDRFRRLAADVALLDRRLRERRR